MKLDNSDDFDPKNNNFHLISLGCPKNRVDSERILGAMINAGFSYTEDPSAAGTIVINTCSFIRAAVEESVGMILDYHEEFPESALVVAGCLPARYKDDLKASLPEIPIFIEPDQIADLPLLVRKHKGAQGRSVLTACGEPALGRVRTTTGFAYLKISEGCNRRCTYCTIPSIRGPLASAEPEELEKEARLLVQNGIRELVIVAQDVSSYGLDKGRKDALVFLLEKLRRIEELKWIRLMYLHPHNIPDGLVEIINDSPNILPYLDIPFQHVSEKVLKSMGRPWKDAGIRKLTDQLRSAIPGLVLRTTLMVGFPAEGEREFQELASFVKDYEIDHVGVFAYSPEEGTAAFELGDPVPKKVKNERSREITKIHARFAAKRNKKRIGKIEDCIIEGLSNETDLLLQGRVWDQAPEVDGLLFITSGDAVTGEIHRIEITAAHRFDLFGEIV